MKALILLSALLVGINANSFINCDLSTGAGCRSSGNFFINFAGITPGGRNGECVNNYRMRVLLAGPADGFYCYFVTENHLDRGYAYTISQNSFSHAADNTAYINQYSGETNFKPRSSNSQPYVENYWYYNDFHSPFRTSWAYYAFENDKITYYSENLDHYYQAGHPFLFEPNSKTVYIGMNRKYEDRDEQTKGLCQVYCATTQSEQFGSPGLPGADPSGGSPPSGKPTPPPPRP